MLHAIITTIQPPTACMVALAERLQSLGAPLIVVGDSAGPAAYPLPGARLLTLADQLVLPYRLAERLPVKHYARKNLGYLTAIAAGASMIYETDDDNAPQAHWAPRTMQVDVRQLAGPRWLNVYRAFTDQLIWPRGLPLDRIGSSDPDQPESDALTVCQAPVQQGLVDGSPDVDAVWRLVLDRPFRFERRASVAVPPGTWCPFNTQSTWWWPSAYPLLYLPSYCSFRMTDIWRGLVAQRCLWAMGSSMVFHAAEVDQQRNEHNLMRDFEHEVPGYLNNDAIAATLESLDLRSGSEYVAQNLRTCYEALVAANFLPAKELELLDAWLDDLSVLGAGELGER
jgi:hypothetical protein